MITRFLHLSTRGGCMLAAVLFFSHLAVAEDFYIAQAARGNGSGSSAANARSVEWFNDSSNWSSPSKVPGRIGPGDTVRLIGTVQTPLTFRAGGVSGKPITLRFESGARMSSPAWPSSGAIVINDHDYVIVDGGGQGVIENTASGSSGSFAHQADSVGVYSADANHLTIRDLIIRNLYRRTDRSDTRSGGQAVRIIPSGGRKYENILISGCVISEVETGIAIIYRPDGASNVEVSDNTISYVNHGIRVGDAQSGSRAHNFRIRNNTIYGFSRWDEPGSNKFHHNGIFCFAVSGDSEIRNFSIYSNRVGSDFGSYATSGIYLSGRIFDTNIHNNLLIGTPNTPANGLITFRLKNTSSVNAYNNTFIGNGSSGRAFYLNGQESGRKTVRLFNNLATRITFVAVTFSDTWAITADRNLGHNLVDRREYSYSSNTTGRFQSFETWQKLGFDANGLNGVDPLLDSDHRPRAGSPAIGAGTNLLSLFSIDFDGQARPSTGGWTIGAFEGVRSSGGAVLPSLWQLLSGGEQLSGPWKRLATGGRQLWPLEGGTLSSRISLNATDPSWSIITTADFNRDRRADIFWRNRDSGELRVWIMDGSAEATVESLGVYDPAWRIRAAADFNRDGLVDFIAQNGDLSQTQVWLMDGSRLALGLEVGDGGRRWRVAGTGDFDGDGGPDLVWQDPGSGEARITLMKGTVAYYEALVGGPGAGWRLAAVADLNANGVLDFVWQESASGRLLYWIMNGLSLGEAIEDPNARPGWEVVAAADIGGDGKVDLLSNVQTFSSEMLTVDSAPTPNLAPSAPSVAAASSGGGGSGGGSLSWPVGAGIAVVFLLRARRRSG